MVDNLGRVHPTYNVYPPPHQINYLFVRLSARAKIVLIIKLIILRAVIPRAAGFLIARVSSVSVAGTCTAVDVTPRVYRTRVWNVGFGHFSESKRYVSGISPRRFAHVRYSYQAYAGSRDPRTRLLVFTRNPNE